VSHRFLTSIGALAFLASAVGLTLPMAGQSRAATPAPPPQSGALRTPWGHPDLQGIWHEDLETPLQRDPKYGNREFLTDDEVKAADARKAASLSRDRRTGLGTEADVAGAYNAVFQTVRYTSRRTSQVVDPPEGRIPALTAEAQKRNAEIRAYLRALLQGTSGACGPGGVQAARPEDIKPECLNTKPSPRRIEPPPYYNVERMNRADGPEDRALGERCLSSGLPAPGGGFSRITQSPDAVSIYYDIGQGGGFQRIIPISSAPHLPANVHQWWGDSRGRWEGDTLVVDVTNFHPIGFNEKLHVVERWKRVDQNTILYEATRENPTEWTKPWTARIELNRQNEQANRIYYEPRCHEGNYGLAGMLANTRAEEHAFTEGRGPDPATRDIATGGAGE
jgi:hypothetical protein